MYDFDDPWCTTLDYTLGLCADTLSVCPAVACSGGPGVRLRRAGGHDDPARAARERESGRQEEPEPPPRVEHSGWGSPATSVSFYLPLVCMSCVPGQKHQLTPDKCPLRTETRLQTGRARVSPSLGCRADLCRAQRPPMSAAGGKRADADVDAAHTATREMVEETGGGRPSLSSTPIGCRDERRCLPAGKPAPRHVPIVPSK